MPLFKPIFKNEAVVSSNGSIGIGSPSVVDLLTGGDDEYVTADKALQNSDIYSVIYQLSADLASSVLKLDDERMQAMVNTPSGSWSNSYAFWQSVFAQLLLGGEAFVYRWRNGNGWDSRWEYLRPSQVSTNSTNDHSEIYYSINFDNPDVGYQQVIPSSDVLHFKLLSQNGGATGVSPLKALSSEFKIKSGSNRLLLRALKQSVISSGVLKVDGGGLLNNKQLGALSRQFKTQVDSSNGGPIVIDKLSEYKPLEMKSDISSILSQTDWTGKQIAKVYGVPDSVINGTGDQQSSVAMMAGEYAKSLMRFANAIIAELKMKLETNVSIDIKPAIDPVNTDYTKNIATFQSSDLLTARQAQWLLKNSGYLPEDMPDMPNESAGKEENE
ncbi:phage portal protein [Fructobacillus sp. M158]|uniref:phage portal protein n=1 Tax=Fructobacillus parabroussonetiae TaxID=2713174 RepID=UPI00200A6618|nr:phage portal protein [Fructobacillus parabroussonetiae]MCK8617549.1 phage portal protein [Fructobacillus parabroussonetiae]